MLRIISLLVNITKALRIIKLTYKRLIHCKTTKYLSKTQIRHCRMTSVWLCLVVGLLVLQRGGNKTDFVSSCQGCHIMLTDAVLRHRTSQIYKKELQTPAGRKVISKIGSDLVVPSSHAVKLVTA
jgi:hypothetical protein